MVTMVVVVVMPVPANIFIRLGQDRRGYHGRDKCRGLCRCLRQRRRHLSRRCPISQGGRQCGSRECQAAIRQPPGEYFAARCQPAG